MDHNRVRHDLAYAVILNADSDQFDSGVLDAAGNVFGMRHSGVRVALTTRSANRLNWSDHLDPRIASFLKVNELIFKPYDALDLQKILQIRVAKALQPGKVGDGVIEKIAGLSSRQHGDARKAVALLGKSAHLAEKAGTGPAWPQRIMDCLNDYAVQSQQLGMVADMDGRATLVPHAYRR